MQQPSSRRLALTVLIAAVLLGAAPGAQVAGVSRPAARLDAVLRDVVARGLSEPQRGIVGVRPGGRAAMVERLLGLGGRCWRSIRPPRR